MQEIYNIRIEKIFSIRSKVNPQILSYGRIWGLYYCYQQFNILVNNWIYSASLFSFGNSISKISTNAFNASYSELPFSASLLRNLCISSVVIVSIFFSFLAFALLPSDNIVIPVWVHPFYTQTFLSFLCYNYNILYFFTQQ